MCKLFGAVMVQNRVPDELIKFRYFAERDKDGWGLAYYKKNKLYLTKSTQSAMDNHKYVTAAEKANSNLIISHLRFMTRGNLREANTHPFTFDKYVFAHNGTVDISSIGNYLRGKHKRLKGTTDSEVLFHFLVQSMEKYGNFMGLRKAVKEISKVARERHVTSLNFLMSDGRFLYAYKRVYRGPNNLFVRTKKGFYKSIMFSSKPIEDGWVELENGEFMTVDSQDLSVIKTFIRE
ncbi:MAG: class II glutamine amidotransferase [Candidatus Altiarchaeota archaeon]|nr:class II glutamine amidotransferase [Candidatus Altiarchaeota archaeon]